jgi:hypothetical protein
MKDAHDTVVVTCRKAQADALVIDSRAQCRVVDEYDAAQERGEVGKSGGERSGKERSPTTPSAADAGLTRKQVHEARKIGNAEKAKPAVVRKAMDDLLDAGGRNRRPPMSSCLAMADAPTTRRLTCRLV